MTKTNLNLEYSIKDIFRGIYKNLSKKRKKQLLILIILMFFNGLTEIFSIAAVLPFLSILVNQESSFNNKFIQILQNIFKFNNSNFLLLVTLIFVSAILTCLISRIITLYISTRLAASIGSDLSYKCFDRTLSQDYESYLRKNSAEIIAGNTIHINQTVLALYLSLQMITLIIVTLSIVGSLVTLNFNITLSIALFFAFSYLLITLIFKKRLTNNSKKIAESTRLEIKVIKEGMGAFKEIILDGSKSYFLNRYSSQDVPLRRLQGNNQFLAASPRYILESTGIIFICLISLSTTISNNAQATLIPLIGTFALGAQKLLPTVNRIYICWSGILARKSEMVNVLELLNQKTIKRWNNTNEIIDFEFEKLTFKNIYFNYKLGKESVISNLSFTINKGDKVGLIGHSGAGKSTLINMILGLLKPSKGEISINHKPLYNPINIELLKSWQNSISNVPQDIFLLDASFAENIAIGEKKDFINMGKLVNAAKRAQLDKFINSFPETYSKVIGEDGAFLSGGQKQRIGIARAFYKKAKLLVFDESTSSLDNKTEKEIFENINSIARDITIIVISHKLENLKFCNKVFELNKGQLRRVNI